MGYIKTNMQNKIQVHPVVSEIIAFILTHNWAALSIANQNAIPRKFNKKGEQSVLTLGSLCPWYMWDTAWSMYVCKNKLLSFIILAFFIKYACYVNNYGIKLSYV